MFVKTLNITNFRNYRSQSVELSSGINVFSGDNGMGKTNLLEAVYLTSVGRSPRTPRDKELILWGEQRARVLAQCQKAVGDESVEIILSKTENKRVAVNGMPVSRLGELMGVITTVFFSPGELKIVQSSPGERRSFIDIALCQISKAYFYLLSRYHKILAQRNRLLKSGQATPCALDIWDAQLAATGAKIVKQRKGFIKNLSPYACENHAYLSGGAESLELLYEGLAGETEQEIETEFLAELLRERGRDTKNGYTNTGPHKDDLLLKIGGADIRSFGSQGQQRTAALALKLAELQLAHATRGECPILLLDDVLSELDLSRQEKLLRRISGFQTLLTCTHLDAQTRALIGSELQEFSVHAGTAAIKI
ncbi:MAG: DNA replication/repair protein RecF [Firmicutes bacterium]|nr:DNA replication/repair protein RecF [Bacillota bacterium]